MYMWNLRKLNSLKQRADWVARDWRGGECGDANQRVQTGRMNKFLGFNVKHS